MSSRLTVNLYPPFPVYTKRPLLPADCSWLIRIQNKWWRQLTVLVNALGTCSTFDSPWLHCPLLTKPLTSEPKLSWSPSRDFMLSAPLPRLPEGYKVLIKGLKPWFQEGVESLSESPRETFLIIAPYTHLIFSLQKECFIPFRYVGKGKEKTESIGF